MNPLELVNLTQLMERTSGRPEIVVALIDGPVLVEHPDLSLCDIRDLSGTPSGSCSQARSVACVHGTLVAGILSAKRGGVAPAICPNCTLLVRPIFLELTSADGSLPSATPDELADSIADCIGAGAVVLNMSVGLTPSANEDHGLQKVLDYAAKRGVITVAAAGNHSSLGSSVITRHPWVIPVTASDLQGNLSPTSNIGNAIGKNGLSAPGEHIPSLGTDGKPRSIGGTSAATPFVTGTVALLWSEFPDASAGEIKAAVTQAHRRRRTLVPPILDAQAATEMMSEARIRGNA